MKATTPPRQRQCTTCGRNIHLEVYIPRKGGWQQRHSAPNHDLCERCWKRFIVGQSQLEGGLYV